MRPTRNQSRGYGNMPLIALFGGVVLLFLLYNTRSDPGTAVVDYNENIAHTSVRAGNTCACKSRYDDTYPKTDLGPDTFRFVIVTDLDKRSKIDEHTWHSLVRHGSLRRMNDYSFTIVWEEDEPFEMKGSFSKGGRGMELSDLVFFNGHLYTCDDRTGIVYEMMEDGAGYRTIPREILMEGNGDTGKELKCEWMSVKDELMYVGGFGKEFVDGDTGLIVESSGPMWVKTIDVDGHVSHHDWRDHYVAMRKATGTEHPAYLLHESAEWNSALRRWFFLPRRVSLKPYNEVDDEIRGSNIVISINGEFDPTSAIVEHIGRVVPTHGFSAFRFIPGSDGQEVIALKTVEKEEEALVETYITVFNLDGVILLDETKIGNVKYEGIEFV